MLENEIEDISRRFGEHADQVKTILERNTKALEETKSKSAGQIDALSARMSDVEQKMVRRPGGGALEFKSAGEMVVESEDFKSFVANKTRGVCRIEVKTVQTIGSGNSGAGGMIAPDVQAPVALPRQRLTVRNLLAPGRTNSNSVWFAQQIARQNLSATVAEGAAKPQSDLTMQLVQTPVATIATWMLAARQALDDAPAMQSLIDAELRYMLAITEEQQLLSGDGTGSNLRGLLPQATAYSAPFSITDETLIDRVMGAIIQSEQSNMPATGIVLNTADWGKARLTKDGMGRYILGDPASATPAYMWGLPVVWTPSISAGTFLVGSFALAAQIFDRMDAEVLISTEDSDNFRKNLITIRAEERLALAVKVPTALITGSLPT